MTTNDKTEMTLQLYSQIEKFCRRIIDAAEGVLEARDLPQAETAYRTLLNHIEQKPEDMPCHTDKLTT